MIPPFVTVPWVLERLDDVVLADVRVTAAAADRAAYLRGHLPGAVFVDLDADLAGPPSPSGGRHPLPEPGAFASAMERCGIGDTSTVIAYDDAGGVFAARLVWMLRRLGVAAAILDGGLGAWDGPLESGDVPPSVATFTVRPWPAEHLADTDDVAQHSEDRVLVDARAPERYRGVVEPLDPRAGHIPGARNLPFADNLVDGRLRPEADLAERFAGLEGRDVIVHCGSGVTACHDLLAMELVGVNGRLYVGSWSAWSSDPDRPVATGPDADGDGDG